MEINNCQGADKHEDVCSEVVIRLLGMFPKILGKYLEELETEALDCPNDIFTENNRNTKKYVEILQ